MSGSDVNAITKLAENYAKHPLIQALIQLLPSGAAVDSLLQRRADEMKSDRLHTFFQELSDGKIELTEELISQEDFLHQYFSTVRAACSTRNHKKIQLLARFLKFSFPLKNTVSADEREDLFNALDEISLREFVALSELRKFELSSVPKEGESDALTVSKYWELFKEIIAKDHGISLASFDAFMTRLERTGLYLRLVSGYWDYKGDMGKTTPQFARLVELIGTA